MCHSIVKQSTEVTPVCSYPQGELRKCPVLHIATEAHDFRDIQRSITGVYVLDTVKGRHGVSLLIVTSVGGTSLDSPYYTIIVFANKNSSSIIREEFLSVRLVDTEKHPHTIVLAQAEVLATIAHRDSTRYLLTAA